MRKFTILLLTILWSMVAIALQGQNISFNHLTTDDGLSQFSVNSLYIDEGGVLWIGTREGLNRYDGKEIQTYKLRKNDPYSLFCNTVLRLTGNENGKIYLLCTEGVAEFNLATRRFTTLLQGNINSIYYKNALFIGKKNEIYRYNEQTGNFDLYYQVPAGGIDIFCMHIDRNHLWIGTTNDGVYRLNLTDKTLAHPIPAGNITSIYCDSRNELWIGSWEEGLHHVKTDGTIETFAYDSKNPHSLSSNFVRACCEDNQGNIWIGTFNGLNRYDKSTGTFQNHTAGDERSEGLTHSSIWCIVKDNQGTLWLGTYFGGVNYFNPEYDIYNRYTYSPIEKKGLSNPVVGRTVEDKYGNLWIGTEGGGLNHYDRFTHEFKWFRPGGPNSISQNNVKALYYDPSKEIIWIGTHLGGLNKLDIRSGRFTHYRTNPGNTESLPSDIIRDIAPYRDSLIVATQNGICLFNPADGKCRQLFKDSKEGRSIKMVADITFDDKGTLWIAATGEGVFSYRFDSGQLTNYRHDSAHPHSISNNNVNNIMQDSKGNLWFATSGSGLDLYHPSSNDFENFDQEQNGLASDCIYEVCQSPTSGQLLIITNEGFSIFDQNSRRFRNYSAENGFPLTSVNENALCVTRDGEIFLGGTQGMISFHETELNFTPKPYNIILSRLIVNGDEIQVGDETGILEKALSCTREITLNADQSMFSIEFATSNYVAANKDDIIYKLEGFSNDWNSTRGLNNITYTNLNAGTYTLLIKPSGKDESLCPQVSLTIRVLPPYYKTPLAYLLYLLVTGGLLWYLVRTYKTRIKLRESLKYEQKHIRDVETLNQSKLRFFTNISHEFRTPLTLIVAQVETLMQLQNFTPGIYNKVLSIYKNSIQLRELITELLDFRKQEQGHMKIKVSPHNIVDFLYENYLLFLEYASTKQIDFLFEKETDEMEVWYDQKQMQKVINNLLSNAFKHTKAEGCITLSIRSEENLIVIRVTDTGSGIDTDKVDKIFDRFYQIDPTDSTDADKTGTGIGLALTKGIVELHHGSIRVESEPGKGASFIVSLQRGNAQFDEEQISNNPDSVQQIETSLPENDAFLKAEIEENVPNKRLPDATILIVEDNESIRQMLAALFKPFYEVLTAADGEEGLELVQNHMPHIVVSDVVMPRMSGTELCKRIKSDFNTCHIPVVLLTARTAIEQNIEGLRIGADDYITKPFNTGLLISRCNNLVNSRILLQEKFSKQPQATARMLATNPIDKEILDRATAIIEQHLDDTSFNVNVFAREMMMARTNLFTKLKAITGQTPNDFILTIRLKKGALMLRNNPELNVTEISDKIGFSSPRYFSKCFKEVYQVSPLVYRKGE
ncbi:signal transduction histidine kinase [Bacteroides zoogleoformans]|uniref:histidine kinase n=2 Tax=Bacteroides zoogleoformans TaxID=28119 RepID=A0ABM6T8I1_9BACE|nr:hybrid sensor histidine kinase/response regulator [Bacteroides zoogleoformans]TWJ18472.1 signal transduction histidine kinase [Bacteroides zoogleoformans]